MMVTRSRGEESCSHSATMADQEWLTTEESPTSSKQTNKTPELNWLIMMLIWEEDWPQKVGVKKIRGSILLFNSFWLGSELRVKNHHKTIFLKPGVNAGGTQSRYWRGRESV